jgi:diguanylate cyclase (GGDEF)-like protein
MNSIRASLIGVWIAALFGVSWFLYYQTEVVKFDMQNLVVPALRELRQLDAEWNADILRSRIGIHGNYDPVTTPLKALRVLEKRLNQAVETAPGNRQEAALHKLQETFSAKEELVEQFKSQNSMFRNSLNYFPTAVEEFKSALRTKRPDMPVQARLLNALEAKSNSLLTDVLIFNLMPDAALREQALSAIDDLEHDIYCCSDDLRERLVLLATHARIILEQRMAGDAIIRLIAAVPTASGIDALADAFDTQFKGMLNEKQRYRTYLVGYSAFLLILLAYVAWRLMKSYKLIAQGNQRLQAANETLEQRVAERTAELQRQSAQLAELARHDALTGLINRRELMVRLVQALQRAERRERVVVLMFIDLDGFKAINDTHGHATGDLVLKEVAARVQRHVRQEDSLARIGGDEFVIMLSEVVMQEGALRVANAALRDIGGIAEVDGRPVQLSASIGISSVRGSAGVSQYPDLLLSRADAAMYQAKQQGKNCYCFSEPTAWEAGKIPDQPVAASR